MWQFSLSQILEWSLRDVSVFLDIVVDWLIYATLKQSQGLMFEFKQNLRHVHYMTYLIMPMPKYDALHDNR